MRFRIGWVVLGILLAASAGEAGWFGKGKGAPKPSDDLFRSKAREDHKVGHPKHTPKHESQSWGRQGSQVYRFVPFRLGHYNDVK